MGGQAEVLFREGRLVSVRFGARRSVDALVKALVLTRGPWTASLGPVTGDAELQVKYVAQPDLPQIRRQLAAAGLVIDLELATWHLHPFTDDADFHVTVLHRP